jgi:hypothetical protein
MVQERGADGVHSDALACHRRIVVAAGAGPVEVAGSVQALSGRCEIEQPGGDVEDLCEGTARSRSGDAFAAFPPGDLVAGDGRLIEDADGLGDVGLAQAEVPPSCSDQFPDGFDVAWRRQHQTDGTRLHGAVRPAIRGMA